MNCDNPLPRVGFAQLKNYINKKVLFVGKIESMNNGLVNMQAPDGSKVVVQANSHYDTPFVEVTGVVVDPMTIREESHVSFGENFGECACAGATAASGSPYVTDGMLCLCPCQQLSCGMQEAAVGTALNRQT